MNSSGKTERLDREVRTYWCSWCWSLSQCWSGRTGIPASWCDRWRRFVRERLFQRRSQKLSALKGLRDGEHEVKVTPLALSLWPWTKVTHDEKNTKKVIKSRQQYTKRSISLSIQTISRVFFHTFKPIKHHLWLSVNHYDRHKANHSSFVLRLNCAQANPAKWPQKFRLVFKAVSWQQLSKKIPARLQPQRKLDRLQHLCQTTKVDV